MGETDHEYTTLLWWNLAYMQCLGNTERGPIGFDMKLFQGTWDTEQLNTEMVEMIDFRDRLQRTKSSPP